MDFFLFVIFIFTLLLVATALASIFLKVPYVPTKKRVIEKILKEAKIKKGDRFYDLGCGDGRMLIEAEKKKKVKAIGYEIAPLIYIMAIIKKFFARSKATIHFKNYFHENLSKADIVFCYLTPEELQKLAKKLKKECKKGTRIISNTFKIQGWRAEKIIKKNKQQNLPTLYFYQI